MRKWRMPVKTMASPCDPPLHDLVVAHRPPGWMTAVAPASAAAMSPSAKGKKASEATTDPRVSGSLAPMACAASAAFSAAMRAESTRLVWPAPMPTVAPSRKCFDLTCLRP
jgi:hypothetical protein